MTRALRIKRERLWSSLMDMARIGETPRGGCNRQALTDTDRKGRDLFARWCEAEGCVVRVDRMGNLFARRAGSHGDEPPVLIGSHLDTQPTGGKFDGVYGVLAGLEVVRVLNEAGLDTRTPVDVVVWTNEEGARFSPAMIGSGVWAGEFELSFGLGRADRSGATIGQELERIGYAGDEPCSPFPIKAAFEAHIEQGPILEREALQVGIVTGVQGMNWYDVTLTGVPCHAGPTPMEGRRDPFMALHPILRRLYQLAAEHKPWARVTCGDARVEPGSRNTVPEVVVLSVDLRHPDQATLDRMDATLRRIVDEESDRAGIEARVRDEWRSPAVVFTDECVEAVRGAVRALGYSHREMVSGAGHDSVYVSRVAPTGMIFVPCAGGLSHNEAESASAEDLEAGCNVLLHAVLDRANDV